MNQHLRSALRFATYIRAMGGEPIPYRHGSHWEWALDLQRQHERLRQGLDPNIVSAAKRSARELIGRMGYRLAAEEATPVQVPASDGENSFGVAGFDHDIAMPVAETNALRSEVEKKARRLAEIQCRRKFRHDNYWTAVQHALRLGRDVRTYACPICDGIHCGNPPDSERTREYRRARKRLRTIHKRLVALDEEWVALVREKKALLRQLGESDVLAAMMSEITGQIRRLAKLVGLWARTGPA